MKINLYYYLVPNTKQPSKGQIRTAQFFTVLLQIITVWHLVGVILRLWAPEFVNVVAEGVWVTNIPGDPSLLWCLLLGVLASGFMRHHRAALWVFLIIFQFTSILLAALLAPFLGEIWADPSSHTDVINMLLGTVFAIVSTIGLIWARPALPARVAPRAWWRALATFAGGFIVFLIVGFVCIRFAQPDATASEAVKWVAASVMGTDPMDSPPYLDFEGPAWLFTLTEAGYSLSAIAAISMFLRSGKMDSDRVVDDELAVRRLLLNSSNSDSLGYFATRDDRHLVLSADAKAAISFKLVNGVTLAAGDPLGEVSSWPDAIKAWKANAIAYGWVPAVISASEAGAKAYVDAGLHAVNMGDEAIIETANFHLDKMRAVRRAIAAPRNAGYSVKVRRQADIEPSELHELATAADCWRSGEERGFSMALGRIGDIRDERIVIVSAYDASDQLRALLTFVPWERGGVSLDFMRRSPQASSGVNELMMSELVAASSAMGIKRISLNFAMFRNLFAMSERIGATPLQRFNGKLLMLASKWWQLHSLYESNAKYQPIWQPRLLCYSSAQQLTRTVIACGIAEGFLPRAPKIFRSKEENQLSAEQRLALADKISELYSEALNALPAGRKLTQQEQVRHNKLAKFKAAGIDPYPHSVARTISIAKLTATDHSQSQKLSIVGRIMRMRDHGGIIFADLREQTSEFQVALERSSQQELWRSLVDRGDVVSVTGTLAVSRSGEPTVFVDSWQMAAKCLVAPPDKYRGVRDPQIKVRARHMDLATSTSSYQLLLARSATAQALRTSLTRHGYLEVETPILQRIHGGANARPFRTHINAYDLDLTLRIAPELFLKRLCVAGVEKVFELGRNFRNEGADATHNPEFTSLEAYQAYGDYFTMRDLTRQLIIDVAIAVHGEPKVPTPDGQWLAIDGSWRSISVHEAVSRAVGEKIDTETSPDKLRQICHKYAIAPGADATAGALVTELYDELVEGQTVEPTFYFDFPVETSPLTAPHRKNPALAERWDLVAFGMELGTAYTELTDPIDQRNRLTKQSLLAAAGDPEAMEVDEEFLSALEFGMRPTGGLGIGVDRLAMFLVNAPIRETLSFPFVKPEQ